MSGRIVLSRTANGWRLLLPSDLRFDDYRELRAAVVDARGHMSVLLDLKQMRSLPTWLIGFLLHAEESLGIQVGVIGADRTQCAAFAMTGTARFLHASNICVAQREDAPQEFGA